MAIKTYVDGGKQAITFNNDTQPVAVYVDGDLQENVSFVPDTVQGTGSVEYRSEYKKNHIEYEIQGTTSQVLLPTEYQQVEYIESTGTQYINTGVSSSTTIPTRIEAKIQWTETQTRQLIGGDNGCYFGVKSGKYEIYELSSINASTTSFDSVLFEQDLTASQNVLTVNNNEPFRRNISTFMSRPIICFALGLEYTADYNTFCKIAIFKIYQNNKIIRNLIPCYRKADNVIGMYDLVNGVFYTNSGTGTFVKGADYNQTLTPTPETPIPIENANDNGMSVILRGENLFNAQGDVERNDACGLGNIRFENNYIENASVKPSAANYLIYSKVYKAGTYTVSAKGEYASNSFTFRFLCTAKYNGGTYNSYYKSYYFDFLKDSLPQNTFTFTTTEDFQIGFAWSASPSNLRGIIYDIMLTPTSQAVEYKPYVEETVEIPTSVNNIPLLFSEYDKITVDRVNNEVKYHNGGYSKTLNGNEAMGSSTTLSKVWVTIPFKLTGGGFCNQFLSPTDFIFSNNLSFGDSGMAFPMSRFSSANALTAFLAEQYNNGTPVVILAQKETPTPYNITSTDLGQSLLNLATQNQTNYFEVQGNSNAPLTPINFTFAKWGGRDENNNNT